MEQYSQYLLRMKSNNIHTCIATSNQSWEEEQAFTEDIGSEGPLGGFTWPPRCYACSFCKRMFKSAQALGGHMNVHRRDRARLNQPICLKTGTGPPESSNPSDVMASFYSNRIIQGDLVTKKLTCMNHMFSKETTDEAAEHTDDGGDIKRRRTDGGSQAALIFVACSSSDKEIDLELRLGDSPTVN